MTTKQTAVDDIPFELEGYESSIQLYSAEIEGDRLRVMVSVVVEADGISTELYGTYRGRTVVSDCIASVIRDLVKE